MEKEKSENSQLNQNDDKHRICYHCGSSFEYKRPSFGYDGRVTHEKFCPRCRIKKTLLRIY